MALIYVVEDDKNISEIESFALKNAGHQIVECACAKEFHSRYRSGYRIWCCLILCCRMKMGFLF